MRVVRLCYVATFAMVVAGSSIPKKRYDAIVIGTGLKESLLAGLLASQGKEVLMMEATNALGGSAKSLDLAQLAELTDGPGARLPSESKIGKPGDYRIERAPKVCK
jgi:Rab GDP dissociation inhibitor